MVMALSSKTVAAEDKCDRDGEEAEPEGEQDQVQHWLLLAVAFCQPSSDPNAPEALMRLKARGDTCPAPHMKSRGAAARSYKDPIKTAPKAQGDVQGYGGDSTASRDTKPENVSCARHFIPAAARRRGDSDHSYFSLMRTRIGPSRIYMPGS